MKNLDIQPSAIVQAMAVVTQLQATSSDLKNQSTILTPSRTQNNSDPRSARTEEVNALSSICHIVTVNCCIALWRYIFNFLK
jgi:hypothetical protein